MATAPVLCCTALYVAFPALRSGNMHTLAWPATWESPLTCMHKSLEDMTA